MDEIQLQCDRMCHRLLFEHRENNRLPKKLKLSIFFTGPWKQNVHSIIDNQSVNMNLICSGPAMMNTFYRNCNMQKCNWDRKARVAKIQIFADFPDEAVNHSVFSLVAQAEYNPFISWHVLPNY